MKRPHPAFPIITLALALLLSACSGEGPDFVPTPIPTTPAIPTLTPTPMPSPSSVPTSPTLSSSSSDTPPYVKPDSFTEQDVTVGSGEWLLPGTLTLPTGSGPFPAVLLVHGFGSQDRDGTTGPNKPLRDLAHGLATTGIAVLRYDKRTFVYPRQLESLPDLTLDQQTTEDALAALALLRATPNIDPRRVYPLGHSFGGFALPRIASRDPSIAGLIIMAGPTHPFEDVIVDQYLYLYGLDGTVTPNEQRQLDDYRAQAARVKSPDLSKDTPAGDLPLSLPASFWLDLRDYYPAQVAATLKQPMLILQGEADYQVTMSDFQDWKAALQSRPNAQFKSYPGLYHLFMPIKGPKATPDDYDVPAHVEPAVIADIVAWLKQR